LSVRPATRAAITAGSIILVAAIALTFRTLNAFGVFTDVTPQFVGECERIDGLAGPEDIVVDDKLRVAFISAADRRAKASGKPSPQDGLYSLQLIGAGNLTKLSGTPGDFHPHGISLYRAPNGDETLMAINHRSDGTSSVDSFDVVSKGGAVKLRETASIEGGELVSPNAVAAVDQNRFYVTNDHTSTSAFGRMLDDLLVLPRANVLYFNGNYFRVVADRLNFPSGAALSPDGKYLYVSEAFNRRLDTYARSELSGALDPAGTLEIPSNLDNLRFDTVGNLWVASHPGALAMAAYRSDPAKPAPSEIFRVTLANGVPQSATLVYADRGKQIGGSSVAVVSGKLMLIGSPWDDHILYCQTDR
jgi:arylesterase / paraoxonase